MLPGTFIADNRLLTKWKSSCSLVRLFSFPIGLDDLWGCTWEVVWYHASFAPSISHQRCCTSSVLKRCLSLKHVVIPDCTSFIREFIYHHETPFRTSPLADGIYIDFDNTMIDICTWSIDSFNLAIQSSSDLQRLVLIDQALSQRRKNSNIFYLQLSSSRLFVFHVNFSNVSSFRIFINGTLFGTLVFHGWSIFSLLAGRSSGPELSLSTTNSHKAVIWGLYQYTNTWTL